MRHKILGGLPLLWFALASPLFSIQYPVSPDEPTVDSTQSTVTGSKTVEDTAEFEVRVIFASGDDLTGSCVLPGKVSFYHYRDGLTFHKTINLAEVKRIQVIEYRSKFNEESEKQNSVLHEFEPSNVVVEMKSGKTYNTGVIFQFLLKIPLSTEEGDTTVYTYFADRFDSGKGWRDVESKDPDFHRNNPHPLTVSRIDFLSVSDD